MQYQTKQGRHLESSGAAKAAGGAKAADTADGLLKFLDYDYLWGVDLLERNG